MTHRLKASQYAILICIMLTASVGDTLLSRGMAQVGPVDLHHLGLLWHALFNPFVDIGIVLLIGFFASYMTALSWADLTFVMPATAFGYVVVALLSRFWLHEHLSVYRWIGILLITSAVGFVANSPSRTEHPTPGEPPHELPPHGLRGRPLMHTIALAAFIAHSSAIVRSWSCIVFVAALAISGECLIAGAMRRLGDLDRLRTGTGLRSYLGPIRAVLSSPIFIIGALCMALNFFAMLFTLSLVDLSLAAPAIGSLTYVGNAIAAKLFLHENVDRRRWLATSFLAIGVILVSR